jgi:tetratricopeptide (TPR) repeat protein
MKRLAMILAATSLLMCGSRCGWSAPVTDTTNSDNTTKAQTAEDKGDLARVHKDYVLAIGYYMTALRADRKNAQLYNKLGVIELQLHARGPARKYFALAVKYDPQYSSALNNLGAVALLDKKYSRAVGYFKESLAIDESSAPTHLNLAESWVGLKEIDRAMNEYARALELDADVLSSSEEGVVAQVMTQEERARVSYMIAKSYMKRGNLEGALDYLGRAKEQHYPDLASVYSDRDFSALWQDPRLAKIIKR